MEFDITRQDQTAGGFSQIVHTLQRRTYFEESHTLLDKSYFKESYTLLGKKSNKTNCLFFPERNCYDIQSQ